MSQQDLLHNPDEVIEKAKNEDLVVDFVGRMGARPFFRYTPYRNKRGVKCNMWTCISVFPKFMPGENGHHDMVFNYPRIIEPDREDYPVYIFTDEWIWEKVNRCRGVKLQPVDETPFGGPLFEGWLYEEE